MSGFLGIERISLGPWPALERAVQRLFIHAGFQDVRLVGGSGDGGADLVASQRGKTWAVQVKYRSTAQTVGEDAVSEVVKAAGKYAAEVGVVAANCGFDSAALERAGRVSAETGVQIFLWTGEKLLQRYRELHQYAQRRDDLRPYQDAAVDAINAAILGGERRGLLLMATGLGKTRVAASVMEQWLNDHPRDQVLVVAPHLALVPQLEASLWPYLPKHVATHILTGSEKPSFESGVLIATEQSMVRQMSDHAERFGLAVVDEAHHAPADGYRTLLDVLHPRFLLGMTATPWRTDERHLEDIFGPPLFTMDIVEGMQLGYLADVEYHMFVDNINWQWVRTELRGSMSVKELNRRLFIPERDDAAIERIASHIHQVQNPRTIIFCRSIRHAEVITNRLKAAGLVAQVVHSRIDRFQTTEILRSFRYGDLPVIVTVDMLNEGIDVPDVNLIVFLRVTHSRRIFVQQLGRGLRVKQGKGAVRVLDFVSDIRRVAQGLEINRLAHSLAGRAGDTVLRYPDGEIVRFEGDDVAQFVNRYLSDVAELADGSDDSKLKFPTDELF